MMKEAAERYYKEGESCSRCILRGAAETMEAPVTEELLSACEGFTGGFGIGEMCSGILAGVMVLGMVCPKEEVLKKRLFFLLELKERLGSLHCSGTLERDGSCAHTLKTIGEVLEVHCKTE